MSEDEIRSIEDILRYVARHGAQAATSGVRDLAAAATAFGLTSTPPFEITREEAVRVIASVLGTGLAYGGPTDLYYEAADLAVAIVTHLPADARFHTNRRRVSPTAWESLPATNATFDCGVIALHATGSLCIWVEDED